MNSRDTFLFMAVALVLIFALGCVIGYAMQAGQ